MITQVDFYPYRNNSVKTQTLRWLRSIRILGPSPRAPASTQTQTASGGQLRKMSGGYAANRSAARTSAIAPSVMNTSGKGGISTIQSQGFILQSIKLCKLQETRGSAKQKYLDGFGERLKII